MLLNIIFKFFSTLSPYTMRDEKKRELVVNMEIFEFQGHIKKGCFFLIYSMYFSM